MKLWLPVAIICGAVLGCDAVAKAPLYNPALVNIGFTCKWQERCMKQQERSMKRALSYVKKYEPPAWKVQLCNRNASRKRGRVDWLGFNNCIRNPALRPPPIRRTSRSR